MNDMAVRWLAVVCVFVVGFLTGAAVLRWIIDIRERRRPRLLGSRRRRSRAQATHGDQEPVGFRVGKAATSYVSIPTARNWS